MEDDDEFGDLYTDVLTTSFQPPIQLSNSPIDKTNDQDSEKNSIPNPTSQTGFNLNFPIKESTQESERILPASVLKEGVLTKKSIDDDVDDGINIVVDSPRKDDNSAPQDEDNILNLPEMGREEMIPGFSGNVDSIINPNFDDEWDSDESEDDLQIVLNDNDHGPMGLPADEDELVIVADNADVNQQAVGDEQQWAGEEGGEKKEVGDAVKTSVQPKIGYSGHAYHQPFHSQFKYVRPGAQPVPGATPGIPGQVRPPFPMGISAGRGRGDWRPTGIKGDAMPMQKGYGIPPWGTNTAGRGYGSGLDFTLPSHKTIFEVDIDSFEEKPWKLPGIDVTDFFNFGLNEESWKDYRKQLEQLRLGTTMQNKIRVYESGRAEQDYDPDLPPELAAAVGNQDIPPENAVPKNVDAGPTESANVHGRLPHPIGKPIPVDISSGDRLPSTDTRRPRMHDNDTVIEVFCHSSKDDEETTERQDADLSAEVDIEGNDEIDDLHNDNVVRHDHTSHAYKGQKREPAAKRGHSGHSSPEPSAQQHSDRDDTRSAKGKRHVTSPKINAIDEKRRERSVDGQDEESFDSRNSKPSPRVIESDGEQTIISGDDTNDKSFDMEGAEVDDTTKDGLEDKQKPSSQEYDNSDNSKVASNPPKRGNAKIPVRDLDYARRKGRHEIEETGRKLFSAKGREDSHSRESGDPNLSHHRHTKGEGAEENWHRKDDGRQGRWNRVEEMRKTDRVKVREKEDHQSRNVVDKGSWRDFNHERDTGSKLRDRDQSLKGLHNKNRREGPYVSREHAAKEDISHSQRETSSRRKRERDDVSDQWKRDDWERDRDEWHRLKPVPEENISRREREETRSIMRSGRVSEEKAWNSHSRRKDEYRGSSKEHQYPSDQLKRRDQFENESYSQHRMGHEDVYARGNLPGHDEKRARHERPGSRNDRAASHAYDASRVNEHKQKESRRKGKDTESVGHGSSVPSKRKHDEAAGPTSQTVNPKGKTERGSGGNDRRSPKKQKEDALSDEDQQSGSRKGRSKFERWTSNKERDFTTTTSIPSSSLKTKDFTLPIDGATLVSGLHEEPPRKAEGTPQLLSDDKDKDTGIEKNVKAKVTEDKHLDAVEKLKKRSERFKLHTPSEKDTTTANKKTETEASPSAQTEPSLPVSDVKPERPARKRRWTGN